MANRLKMAVGREHVFRRGGEDKPGVLPNSIEAVISDAREVEAVRMLAGNRRDPDGRIHEHPLRPQSLELVGPEPTVEGHTRCGSVGTDLATITRMSSQGSLPEMPVLDLFETKRGTQLHESNPTERLGEICKELGLKGYVLHSLRKYWASTVSQQGMD